MTRYSTGRTHTVFDRFQLLFFVATVLALVIIGKLGMLQIVQVDEYRLLAEEQNSRGVVLPAKRGDIYARDYRTDELVPLAQNSTTYTIFADPLLLESESQIADLVAPLVYVPPAELEELNAATTEEVTVASVTDTADGLEENIVTDEQVVDTLESFKRSMIDRLATKNVVRRVLGETTAEERELIADAHLPGVSVSNEMVTVNPTLIDDPETVATQLATILNGSYDDVYPLLLRKKVRYVRLATRVASPDKNAVLALGIRGIGAIPEYRRVYPEGSLAAQLVGFLNHDEEGVYGTEGAHQRTLAGKNGLRRTQVDPFNRQITVGDITIDEAEDGASLVLTVDRAIQGIVEEQLAKVVEHQRADGGQAIVMDPHTGAIMALAHYPTFDPNDYGAVYEREALIHKERMRKWVDEDGTVREEPEEWWETAAGEEIIVEYEYEYVIRDGYRYPVFHEGEERTIYANRVGSGAFALKALTDPYEPGSVFKPIVMAMAIDAGEVTPTTRSPYNSPVPIDEMVRGKPVTIKNAQGKYFGKETMTEVLMHSSNIGMTFIAQQLGRASFYDYLRKFGFAERTDVDLEGENAGYLENYTRWSESELITKAFGQGITVNLIQMATAYSALANGGLLMRPYIVSEELHPDGHRVMTEPETVRRVISPETAATLSAMLISSVENGFAKPAQVPGYFIAGKTGTSQTYSKTGRALSDLGTTVAAFGGYAPATDPKFVLIVKIDKPRVSEWGASVAAPLFHDITAELLKNYFAIPPMK